MLNSKTIAKTNLTLNSGFISLVALSSLGNHRQV